MGALKQQLIREGWFEEEAIEERQRVADMEHEQELHEAKEDLYAGIIENQPEFIWFDEGEEVWADISGFEGLYKVSSLGRIKSFYGSLEGGNKKPRPKELIKKAPISKRGYPHVMLVKNQKQHPKQVHRLVGIAFIPNPLNLPCLNHKNGIKTDCRAINLEWCTYSQNTIHAYNTGLAYDNKGTGNGRAKLTPEQVLSIRKEIGTSSYTAIGKKYGVSYRTISMIGEGKLWGHLVPPEASNEFYWLDQPETHKKTA